LARRTRNNNHPQTNIASANQSTFTSPDEHLDISMLETWLWDAACAIRGSTDAPKFKDFILPLVFFKRLSDVFDDEFATHVKEYGDEATAREIIEADLAHALKCGTNPIIRFYIPKEHNWKTIRNHGADGRLGEFITGAMREVAKLNPEPARRFRHQGLQRASEWAAHFG
jgi:type I restriction enzyme M protein